MKNLLLNAVILLAGSGLVAQAGPADDVNAGIQKLAGEASYTWRQTVVVPADSRFKPGPSEGKTADGLTWLKLSMRNNSIQMFIKGTNIVVADPDPDGGWETLADFESNDNEGPGRFLGAMARNFKLPAAQAADLVADCADLEETNGVLASALTPDGAKKLLTFRRGGSATVSNPSGSAQFWVKDGELTKFEFHVKGDVTFNDNDVTIDRDTTVEISDAGTTKIDVPNDAKKLLP